jgi:hypothetical protein
MLNLADWRRNRVMNLAKRAAKEGEFRELCLLYASADTGKHLSVVFLTARATKRIKLDYGSDSDRLSKLQWVFSVGARKAFWSLKAVNIQTDPMGSFLQFFFQCPP